MDLTFQSLSSLKRLEILGFLVWEIFFNLGLLFNLDCDIARGDEPSKAGERSEYRGAHVKSFLVENIRKCGNMVVQFVHRLYITVLKYQQYIASETIFKMF